MTANEQKVLNALDDPRWDWRTLDGLKKTTGLAAPLILEVLLAHPSEVEFAVSEQHGLLFTLKGRKRRSASGLERALNLLSFGRRPKLA